MIGIAVLIILIFIIGLLLPKERIVSRKGHFNVSPEILYEIVTNNNDWKYRRSLKDLIIHSNEDGIEVWDEISHDGTIIRFQTKEKHPFSFYSFEMEAKLFEGYWTGEFEPDGNGGTVFTATEYIRIKNPFIKTLSYLFFNIGKLMDEYQDDLRKKVVAV
jgi:hypothetical protein